MLLRTVPRTLRAGTPFLRPVSSQTRWYAKSKVPRKPQYTPPARSSPLVKEGTKIPTTRWESQEEATESSHAGSSDKSGQPNHSTAQKEVETSAASNKNTTPQATSPSATNSSSVEDQAAEAKAQAEEEEAQARFLHDITKGIPSTIDAELQAASKKGVQETEGQDVSQTSTGGGRGPKRMPASVYETSADRKRNKTFAIMLAAIGLMTVSGAFYLGQNWEDEEEAERHPDVPNGWGLGLFYNRIVARLSTTMDHFQEPTFPKLLPDIDPAMAPPYTLVLSLEDLLIHNEWTREHGWRMAKRPGVDYFIRYLSQYYELVIFTTQPSTMAGPVIQKLDPFRIAMWPLFREATRYQNGEYVKV